MEYKEIISKQFGGLRKANRKVQGMPQSQTAVNRGREKIQTLTV